MKSVAPLSKLAALILSLLLESRPKDGLHAAEEMLRTLEDMSRNVESAWKGSVLANAKDVDIRMCFQISVEEISQLTAWYAQSPGIQRSHKINMAAPQDYVILHNHGIRRHPNWCCIRPAIHLCIPSLVLDIPSFPRHVSIINYNRTHADTEISLPPSPAHTLPPLVRDIAVRRRWHGQRRVGGVQGVEEDVLCCCGYFSRWDQESKRKAGGKRSGRGGKIHAGAVSRR